MKFCPKCKALMYPKEKKLICNKCGHEDIQMHLLRRKTKNFEVLKHPFFQGRYLFNSEIQNDYRDGKITKEQAARYCRTSSQMIEWNEENRYKIIEIDGYKAVNYGMIGLEMVEAKHA